MWINLPEWLFVVIVVFWFLSVITPEILKHLNAKYANNDAQRKVELATLDKEIAELELEKIRITTASTGQPDKPSAS